tara:strand:+ start:75 stop:266 length:192 start_codon:yes stop_codon:yes gene_type:complete
MTLQNTVEIAGEVVNKERYGMASIHDEKKPLQAMFFSKAKLEQHQVAILMTIQLKQVLRIQLK